MRVPSPPGRPDREPVRPPAAPLKDRFAQPLWFPIYLLTVARKMTRVASPEGRGFEAWLEEHAPGKRAARGHTRGAKPPAGVLHSRDDLFLDLLFHTLLAANGLRDGPGATSRPAVPPLRDYAAWVDGVARLYAGLGEECRLAHPPLSAAWMARYLRQPTVQGAVSTLLDRATHHWGWIEPFCLGLGLAGERAAWEQRRATRLARLLARGRRARIARAQRACAEYFAELDDLGFVLRADGTPDDRPGTVIPTVVHWAAELLSATAAPVVEVGDERSHAGQGPHRVSHLYHECLTHVLITLHEVTGTWRDAEVQALVGAAFHREVDRATLVRCRARIGR